MWINNFVSASSVRPFHAQLPPREGDRGTRTSGISIPGLPWSRIFLVIVLAFLMTGGFQQESADGSTTGRVQVSARVLPLAKVEKTTSRLEKEWEEMIQDQQLQRELSTLGLHHADDLRLEDLDALGRKWIGEREVGNGSVHLEFVAPGQAGLNPVLLVEWISN